LREGKVLYVRDEDRLSRSTSRSRSAARDDLFEKLAVRGVVSRPMADTLRRMKGLLNVVHEYARVWSGEHAREVRTHLPLFRQEVADSDLVSPAGAGHRRLDGCKAGGSESDLAGLPPRGV
jgi:hypothetical protein